MKSTRRRNIIIIIAISIITIIAASSIILLAARRNHPDQDTNPTTSDAPGSQPPYQFNYDWATNHPYVAHAFGGILGDSYTNSYEAFLLNYQLGHRVFEVDFSITDDGKTVAAHDPESWAQSTTPSPNSDINPPTLETDSFTYDNFMSSLWFDKYHPVDLDTLFQILKDYPDIYIVTDTKYDDPTRVKQQFSAFYTAAAAIDLKLLDRFIVQIYKPEMLSYIMEIYPWKSVIYTLYANWANWTPENVLAFSQESGVKLITMWSSWVTSDITKLWHAAGIKIATHTVNQLAYVDQLRSLGADLFYTDFLLP